MQFHSIPRFLRKTVPCSLALCMSILCLTACGTQGDDSEISQDQLPYGATLTLNHSNEISVQHDKRYLDDALVSKISDFYYAIQTQDTALFQSVQLPIYHDYMLSVLNDGQFTDADILNFAYQTDLTAEDKTEYDFSLIDITDAKKGTVYSESANVIAMIDSLCTEQKIPKMSQDIDAAYELSIARFLTEKDSGIRHETGVMLTEETIVALRYQGEWYIMFD